MKHVRILSTAAIAVGALLMGSVTHAQTRTEKSLGDFVVADDGGDDELPPGAPGGQSCGDQICIDNFIESCHEAGGDAIQNDEEGGGAGMECVDEDTPWD